MLSASAGRTWLPPWMAPMLVAGVIGQIAAGHETNTAIAVSWRQLPAIPDREGFAGAFAGTSGEALLVAGGANFPDKRPWEGGTKTWYDAIYLLEHPGGSWKLVGKLPRPTAYGISASTPEGIVCIGGGDAGRHFREVYRLRWQDGQIRTVALPQLPRPCAFASGALLDGTIYVAGGIEKPDAAECLAALWVLDLAQKQPRWRELPPCPGAARMLAVAGVADRSLFLFSGTKLKPGPDGRPVREYLRDAWRYAPGAGWRRLAELPRAAVAAPSPAAVLPGPRLLVISGDDGTKLGYEPENAHPGFPHDILAYDVKGDAWSVLGEAPFSRATAPTTVWRSRVVIPNGESRPGYRSPDVWALELQSQHE